MSETLKLDEIKNSFGKFEVSTIRTVAGGAPDIAQDPIARMFGQKPSDYDTLTAWPFETMIFKTGSRVGLFHRAYATEEEAMRGHEEMVSAVRSESEFGGGVDDFGDPSLTPKEWRKNQAMRATPV